MLLHCYYCLITVLSLVTGSSAVYHLLHEYAGQNFFSGWDFYGSWDNLTLSNTTWVSQENATALNLAYINAAGNAIMRVDNTTNVPVGEMRNSVRITSQQSFDFGSLWIMDAVHLPYGCSVWPAFWTKGPNWPFEGEIDIVEGINMMANNQMALHTVAGCMHNLTDPALQTGYNGGLDCGTGSGCVVSENAPNSYQAGFAAAGGGVWATQFDVSGVFMWFWSRPNIPAQIANATSNTIMDPSTWGPPVANYPTTTACNTSAFFSAQQLVFDIALCGDWHVLSSLVTARYKPNGTGICYLDSVVGPGSPTFDEAYFEIRYVRTYALGVVDPPASSSSSSTQPTGTSTVVATVTANAHDQSSNSARSIRLPARLGAIVPLGLLLGSALVW
ncbi:concanavalin A-like lectin/glucanase domain-containing protein [Sparassis latifolia]